MEDGDLQVLFGVPLGIILFGSLGLLCWLLYRLHRWVNWTRR